MTKNTKLIALAISLISAIAFSSAIMAKGYGMAGCGLGSIVIGPEGKFAQVFAATTNGTSYSQTFGITSGTSNCVENSKAYIKQQQKVFAHVNYKGLKQEMAAGQGQKLNAFEKLLGCPTGKLAKVSQKNYKLFFASSQNGPAQLIKNLKKNNELATSCKFL